MQNEDDPAKGKDDRRPDALPGRRQEAGAEALRQAEARKARAAAALRANLARRKSQGRARRAGEADDTSGLIATKTDDSTQE